MLQSWLKRASIATILAFLATAGPTADDGDPLHPGLPNFHKVDEHLYRGGQPGAGGLVTLKTLGVRTIVNLRHEPALVRAEEAEVVQAGLRYFNVPMHGLGRPTDEQVARVQALLLDPDNWPVFVHCKAGADRTGVMIAYYRVAHAGWTAEQAIREALDHGMMKIEFAKRSFIREFYAGLQSAAQPNAPAGVATPAAAMPR